MLDILFLLNCLFVWHLGIWLVVIKYFIKFDYLLKLSTFKCLLYEEKVLSPLK